MVESISAVINTIATVAIGIFTYQNLRLARVIEAANKQSDLQNQNFKRETNKIIGDSAPFL